MLPDLTVNRSFLYEFMDAEPPCGALGQEDYFFFALSPDGRATAFRSEVGQDLLFYVKANLPRLQASATTETQYDLGLPLLCRKPEASRYPA